MHYTDTLRRHVLSDSDVAKLCRQIYQKHKKALDLLYEHRADPQRETRDLLRRLITDTHGLVGKGAGKPYLFFRPSEWDDPMALNAGKDRMGFFRFVFHSYPDRLDLFLETSPGDEGIRRRLYEMGYKDESLFNYLEDSETSGHPKLYNRTFLTPELYEDASEDDREEEIRRH
jgi:hypothetical protein